MKTIREQPSNRRSTKYFCLSLRDDLLAEPWNPLAQLPNFLCNFLRRFHTVCQTRRPGECSINVSQLADFLLIRSQIHRFLPGLRREHIAGMMLNV